MVRNVINKEVRNEEVHVENISKEENCVTVLVQNQVRNGIIKKTKKVLGIEVFQVDTTFYCIDDFEVL